MPSHAFEDHVGEVRLKARAPTLAALFEEAAKGLAELMLETPSSEGADGSETIAIRSTDPGSLLVDWLNEIIFLSETRHRVYTEARVRRISDTELEAVVRGVVPEALRTAVKAATWHDLRVEQTRDGYMASVTLDV